MKLKRIASNVWFEITWHFECWWAGYFGVVIVGIVVAMLWIHMPVQRPRPVVIKTLAEGTIVNVRATGAWENWCKIELKFEDGTVLLTSYQFINHYKIKEGRNYSIIHHSRIGRMAQEHK